MATDPQIVAAFPWLFEGASPEATVAFLARLGPVSYAPGDEVFRRGVSTDAMVLFPEAHLSVDLDGPRRRLHLADREAGVQVEGEPGVMVGEIGLLRPGPASATVVAMAHVQGRMLDHGALDALLDEGCAPIVSNLLVRLALDLAARVRTFSAVDTRPVAGSDDAARLESAYAHLHGVRLGAAPAAWAPGDFQHSGDAVPTVDDEGLAAQLMATSELAPLGEQTLRWLARTIEIRAASAGEEIVRAGESADGLYLLLDGEAMVEAEAADADAPEFRVHQRLVAGEVFGMVAYLLGEPRTATVTATSDATIGILWPATVQLLLAGGAQGGREGLRFLHWIAAQLAEDHRGLNDQLLAVLA